ncbi:MAG: RNA methyltransferase [Campylobacterales bacterium]|nr:RNA methyltransferase [Campylobacterales bacterium]
MNLTEIKDLTTPELEIYKTLRDNHFTKDSSFIADSPKVVNTLLETDIKFKSIFATQDYYDEFKDLIAKKNIEKLYVADKILMENIVGHKIHHNVMAHGIRPSPTDLEDLGDRILMVDNITSSENIGSIARSCAGIGVDSYLLPRLAPHPYGRRSLRVSMGHISKLKYSIYDDIFKTIEELKKRGYKIYGAEVTADSTPLSKVEVGDKWVILMGHEGHGLSQEVIDVCDEIVTIEMAEGVRSFNVGVASSIIMYKFVNGL